MTALRTALRSAELDDTDLRNVPLFRGCSPEDLRRISRHATPVSVSAGAIIQAQTSLRWVYVILDGTVALAADGHSFLLGIGDVVGVRSCLTRCGTPVDMEAVGDVKLLVIGRAEFLALMTNIGGFGCTVARYAVSQADVP